MNASPMDSPPPLECAGRPVDDTGQPTGPACGTTYGGRAVGDGNGWLRWPTPTERDNQARAAGWSVAGPPMCGRCRKPDPAIRRGLTTTKEQ